MSWAGMPDPGAKRNAAALVAERDLLADLASDLAGVLVNMVIGWEAGWVLMPAPLDEHPEVLRVMKRYNEWKKESDERRSV